MNDYTGYAEKPIKGMRVKITESELKLSVSEYLQYGQNQGKWMFLRLNSGDFIELRGETRRRIKGCRKGTSDFIIVRCVPRLQVIFLELKSANGKQSPEQKEFQATAEAQGCLYLIIRSIEELEKEVENEKPT